MFGFLNRCPYCNSKSKFTPEELECDKALVLWCNDCGAFINQTFTPTTIEKWWDRVDEGEETIAPTITKEQLLKLRAIEKELGVKIHIKDFDEYQFVEDKE